MKSKKQRQDMIAVIVRTQDIRDQAALVKALHARGVAVTQATLSRDLQDLGIKKVNTPRGRQKYMIPLKSELADEPIEETRPKRNGKVLGMEFVGILSVLKTRPGYAAALANEIDSCNSELIAGTIAGYDTVLVMARQDCDREALAHFLQAFS